MSNKIKIVLVGGGTGGHIFPLISVLREAKKKMPEAEFIYYGSGLNFEKEMALSAKMRYQKIHCGKFRRNFSILNFFKNILDLFLFTAGFFQSIYLMLRDEPDLIFSKGGYVSLPVVMAAAVFSIPVILHESDAIVGLSNRIAARFARRVLFAFPIEICNRKIARKATYAGLPLREQFEKEYVKNHVSRQDYLLVVGGSSGAMSLNSKIFEIGAKILEKTKIVHLTGVRDFGRAKNFKKTLSSEMSEKYIIIDFAQNMTELISNAQAVVSRAGATAIFEIASCRKKAIFCPLPRTVGFHQLINAEFVLGNKLAKVHFPWESSSQMLKTIETVLDQKDSTKLDRLYFPASASFIAQLLSDEVEKIKFEKTKRVFLIGIAGVSMRGIAKVLKHLGKQVSGSDLKIGGHSSENIKEGLDLVVYSSAAGPESQAKSEHEKSRDFHIPTIKRSELVGKMMRGFEGISVSGMHGKTTITNIIAKIFDQSGLDPSYLIGADETTDNKSAKLGRGKNFIVEACEYDGSFLDFPTYVAVVSNIEREHLDYFKGGLPDIKNHFSRFMENIYSGGGLIFCADDVNTFEVVKKNILRLKQKKVRVVSYGFKPTCDFCIRDYKVENGQTKFSIKSPAGVVKFNAQIPGKHFALNVAAAFAVATLYQIDPFFIQNVVASYKGASRRFAKVASKNQITLYDDYAHHPTEIKSTLEALNELYRANRKIIVFQPHQQSRFNELYEDFVRVLKTAPVDKIGILPVYKVPGRDAKEKFTSEQLVISINEIGKLKAVLLPDMIEAVRFLNAIAKKDDIIMTMGATDVWKVGEEYLNNLKNPI